MSALHFQKQEVDGQPGIYSKYFVKARTNYTIQTHKGRALLYYTVSKSIMAGGVAKYSAWCTQTQPVAASIGGPFDDRETAVKFCEQHFAELLAQKHYQPEPIPEETP